MTAAPQDLPWRVKPEWDDHTNGCLILSSKGTPIASVLYCGGTGQPRRIAEEIVAAMNAKAAL